MSNALGPGTFILSLDTEMAWGAVDRPRSARADGEYALTRQAIHDLLSLFEKYEIQATWAVVGHLFLQGCRQEDGGKHPEIVRPTYRWLSGDWFDRDPCTDVSSDSFWYGPDMIEQILQCHIPQEIGCHGFSHMIVGDPGCSRECFESELEACRAATADWGIQLRSFVFPRNSIGHLDILAEQGFTSFRGVAPAWHRPFPGSMKRAARFLDAFVPIPPPTTTPVLEQGIMNIPASYQYLHRSGWGRLSPISVRVRKAISSLRRAAQEGTIFHMWFHPFNIASDHLGLMGGLEAILQEVTRLRCTGSLTNQTMGSMASYHLAESGRKRE